MQQGHMWEILVLSVTMRSALVKEQYDTYERTGANDQSIRFDRPYCTRQTPLEPTCRCMHACAWSYVPEKTRTHEITTNGKRPASPN